MIPDEVFVPASITLNGRPVPATQLQGLFHPVYAANPQAGNFWHTWEAYYRPDSGTVYLYASLGTDGAPSALPSCLKKAGLSAVICGGRRFKAESGLGCRFRYI